MSISPVQIVSPVAETLASDSPHSSHSEAQLPAKHTTSAYPPKSGNDPTPEGQVSKSVPAESQLPEDEVQLQRDSQLQNQVIVRYMDNAGNLILQVPGAQMLDFEHTIAAEFQRAKPDAQASAGKVVGQGDSHGH